MMKIELTKISGHTFITSHITKRSKVLDLGANKGEFSLEVYRRWECEIHAVEPTPVLANELRKKNKINVYEMVVNKEGSRSPFKIDLNNSEASCVVKKESNHDVYVEGIKLGDLLKNINEINLIKIDVEGHEIEILMNAPDNLIKEVSQLTVEFHDFIENSEITYEMYRKVCERMRSMGFYIFNMSFWTHGDVLFVNKKKMSLNFFQRIFVKIKGCWIPGVSRVIRRLL